MHQALLHAASHQDTAQRAGTDGQEVPPEPDYWSREFVEPPSWHCPRHDPVLRADPAQLPHRAPSTLTRPTTPVTAGRAGAGLEPAAPPPPRGAAARWRPPNEQGGGSAAPRTPLAAARRHRSLLPPAAPAAMAVRAHVTARRPMGARQGGPDRRPCGRH